MNPNSLYKYIRATYLIAVIAAAISLFFMYREVICPFILIETILKNTPIMLYVRHKKRLSVNTEDWLIPQWFKNRAYPYIESKAELRTIILFLFIPLFYTVPLPFGVLILIFYILPVSLLTVAFLGFKWIKAGKDTPLDGNKKGAND